MVINVLVTWDVNNEKNYMKISPFFEIVPYILIWVLVLLNTTPQFHVVWSYQSDVTNTNRGPELEREDREPNAFSLPTWFQRATTTRCFGGVQCPGLLYFCVGVLYFRKKNFHRLLTFIVFSVHPPLAALY